MRGAADALSARWPSREDRKPKIPRFPEFFSAPEMDARADGAGDQQRHQHRMLVKQIEKSAHALRRSPVIRSHVFLLTRIESIKDRTTNNFPGFGLLFVTLS
jgi:hypothetical protein